MVKMKDSTIEWVGQIPEKWNVLPLKYVVDCNTCTLKEDTDASFEFDYIDIGSVTYGKGIEKYERMKFENAPSRARRVVKENDVILSTVRTYLKATAQIPKFETPVIVSTGFVVLSSRENIEPDFLAYLVQAEPFICQVEAQSKGVSYPATNASDVLGIKIQLPPLDEQRRIASVLQTKCRAIDTIIEKTKASIEEYQKLRKSIVIKAVTKGLDENVPMKSTDSDWIGEIPAHWDYVRIQRLFEEVDERNEDENALLLSLYTSIGVRPRNELEERGNKAVTVINYKKVKQNDIIVNKLLAWMGAIGYSDYEGVTSPDYDVYRAKEGANVVRTYYNEYFRHTCFNGDCYKYGHGIMLMRWRTYPEELLRIKVPNPPKEEQETIAKYLEEKCFEIDKLIEKKQAFIEEMEQYKKSLIYEYVTGKKNVE